MTQSLQNQIKKLREASEKAVQEVETLEALLVEYPDLEHHVISRWGREVYSSALVNAKATHMEYRYSCGCCPDAAVYAMPYVKTPTGGRIYSRPHSFYIGERSLDGVAEDGHEWLAAMSDAGISETVIQLTSKLVGREEFSIDDDEDDA